MTTRLPVVGSSAASTSFCSARLDGPGGEHLYLDGNGKITAGNGTLVEPRPNAFSLPQVTSCPYRTPTCEKSCYVHNLQVAQPDLHALYVHNAAAIERIVGGSAAGSWAIAAGAWIRDNAAAGFRWHVSGDVYSEAYARWIALVVRESPGVRHWIYTRSFVDSRLTEPLLDVCTERGGNLALNLSCDRDNFWLAKRFQETHRAGRLCYMVVEADTTRGYAVGPDPDETRETVEIDIPELGDGDVIFPDYPLRPRAFATLAEAPFWQALTPQQRGLVCPVDAHGKSEKRRCGPCRRCME